MSQESSLRSNTSRLLSHRSHSEYSQDIELVDMGRIDDEDRQYLIIDKDTGDVYDMRNQEHIDYLAEQTTCLQGSSKDQINWQEWWLKKKKINEQFLEAAELGDLVQVKAALDSDKLKDLVAEVNTRTSDVHKWHALHCASYHGHLGVIEYLLTVTKIEQDPRSEPHK